MKEQEGVNRNVFEFLRNAVVVSLGGARNSSLHRLRYPLRDLIRYGFQKVGLHVTEVSSTNSLHDKSESSASLGRS